MAKHKEPELSVADAIAAVRRVYAAHFARVERDLNRRLAAAKRLHSSRKTASQVA